MLLSLYLQNLGYFDVANPPPPFFGEGVWGVRSCTPKIVTHFINTHHHLSTFPRLTWKLAYHTNPRLGYPIYYGTEPVILKLARENRKQITPAEKKLWEQLKNRKFLGIKFRRQHPASRFIADFYCHQAKLIIEVDGGYHNHQDQKEKDSRRERALEDMGIKIIRFSNEEVENDLLNVLDRIKEVIQKLNSTPP